MIVHDVPPAASEVHRRLLAELLPEIEDAWKNGLRPPLERYLCDPRVEAGGASFIRVLFGDLLPIELRRRKKLGELPLAEEYLHRFPQYVGIVEECFGVGAKRIGDYRLVHSLGSGGMGEVFLAINELTEQSGALKVIRGHLVSHSQAVTRFLREIKNLAKLRHANIVAIRTAGRTADGTLFLEMEDLDGENLEQIRRRIGQFKIADACEIICQAARGLDHAHQQHVIHRDLKPSNLMLTRGGQVKLLDFGLAKLRHETPGDGKPGFEESRESVVGTPHFMAPEQLTPGANVDARTDVYGLGAMLYYLLTAETPFGGSSFLEVVSAMATSAPRPLTQFRSDLPTDLCQFVLDMLAKKPSERPACMNAVQSMLCRFATGSELSKLAGDANRAIVDGTSAFVGQSLPTAILASAALSTHEDQHFSLSRTVRNTQRTLEKVPTTRFRWLRANSRRNGVIAISVAILAVLAAFRFERNNTIDRTSFREIDLPWSLVSIAPSGEINTAAWSPDGEKLAYGTFWGELRICRADTLETLHYLDGHGGAISAIAWRNDGQRVVTCGSDGLIQIWTSEGQHIKTIKRNGQVLDVAWQPGGSKFASVENSGTSFKDKGQCTVWDEDGNESLTFTAHVNYASHVRWSHDGRTLITSGGDKCVRIWLEDGTLVQQTAENPSGTFGLSVNRHGVIAAGGGEHPSLGIQVAGTTGWQQVTYSGGSSSTLAWNPTGDWLAVLTNQHQAFLGKFAEPSNGKSPLLQSGITDGISGHFVLWHPTRNRFVTGDKSLTIWELKDDEHPTATSIVAIRCAALDPVFAVDWHPSRKVLATGGGNGNVTLFTELGSRMATLDGHTDDVVTLKWSADGNWLATGSKDSTVKIWSDEGEYKRTFNEFNTIAGRIHWAHTDNQLAVAGDESIVRIYDADQGLKSTIPTLCPPYSLAWSRDDTRLAAGLGNRNGIQIWTSPQTDQRLEILTHADQEQFDFVNSVDYNPASEKLAVGAGYGVAAIYSHESKQWNTLKKNAQSQEWFHAGDLSIVKWNHRGDGLASAANDGRIGIWTNRGKLKLAINIGSPIQALAWSPDDRRLAVGDTGGAVWVWDFAQQKGLVLGRNLSPVTSLDWDSKSQLLAIGTVGGMLRELDVKSGQVIFTKVFLDGQELVTLDRFGLPPDGFEATLDRHFLYRARAADGKIEILTLREFTGRFLKDKKK